MPRLVDPDSVTGYTTGAQIASASESAPPVVTSRPAARSLPSRRRARSRQVRAGPLWQAFDHLVRDGIGPRLSVLRAQLRVPPGQIKLAVIEGDEQGGDHQLGK